MKKLSLDKINDKIISVNDSVEIDWRDSNEVDICNVDENVKMQIEKNFKGHVESNYYDKDEKILTLYFKYDVDQD